MSQNNEKPTSINFETFTLSLGTAIFVALGEIENPVTKKKEQNIGAARQNIDILEILVEKTKGNLNDREEKLLTGILYESRMKYVSISNSEQKPN